MTLADTSGGYFVTAIRYFTLLACLFFRAWPVRDPAWGAGYGADRLR
jgi:hypothetical protein